LTKQVAQLQAQAQQQPVQAQSTTASDALKQQLGMLQQQNTQLQAGVQRWQAAYAQAATIARAKDQQARQETANSTAEQSQINACTQENAQLISTANSILTLYQTEKFRSLLLKSYEPLVGLWQVKLENIVQTYQEKINAQVYYPPATAPGASEP
jgi:septal ring factor EnvC (AmiA/AmiB activator)